MRSTLTSMQYLDTIPVLLEYTMEKGIEPYPAEVAVTGVSINGEWIGVDSFAEWQLNYWAQSIYEERLSEESDFRELMEDKEKP